MTQTAVVNTKSFAASKINWIAAATGLGVLITQFTPMLPAKYQGSATALVGLIGALTTFVVRTFYTTTVVSSSLPSDARPADVVSNLGLATTQAVNVAELQKLKSAQ